VHIGIPASGNSPGAKLTKATRHEYDYMGQIKQVMYTVQQQQQLALDRIREQSNYTVRALSTVAR
jgi:hypothetical protein